MRLIKRRRKFYNEVFKNNKKREEVTWLITFVSQASLRDNQLSTLEKALQIFPNLSTVEFFYTNESFEKKEEIEKNKNKYREIKEKFNDLKFNFYKVNDSWTPIEFEEMIEEIIKQKTDVFPLPELCIDITTGPKLFTISGFNIAIKYQATPLLFQAKFDKSLLRDEEKENVFIINTELYNYGLHNEFNNCIDKLDFYTAIKIAENIGFEKRVEECKIFYSLYNDSTIFDYSKFVNSIKNISIMNELFKKIKSEERKIFFWISNVLYYCLKKYDLKMGAYIFLGFINHNENFKLESIKKIEFPTIPLNLLELSLILGKDKKLYPFKKDGLYDAISYDYFSDIKFKIHERISIIKDEYRDILIRQFDESQYILNLKNENSLYTILSSISKSKDFCFKHNPKDMKKNRFSEQLIPIMKKNYAILMDKAIDNNGNRIINYFFMSLDKKTSYVKINKKMNEINYNRIKIKSAKDKLLFIDEDNRKSEIIDDKFFMVIIVCFWFLNYGTEKIKDNFFSKFECCKDFKDNIDEILMNIKGGNFCEYLEKK